MTPKKLIISVLILALYAVKAGQAFAQKPEPPDQKNLEKGRQLIQTVIEARGGARYLEFKTLIGSGQYTLFEKGISGVPFPFLDYIIYPDRERTDIGKKKKDRNIRVNTGKTGWVYDGQGETLKELDEKQGSTFLEEMEYDIDHLLRGGWKQPGVKAWFYGREETRPGERADVVAVELKKDQLVLLVIDPASHLPLKLVYEKPDEKGVSRNEVRFFQYVPYDGVKFPNIVDFYRDGVQISRVNYSNVQTNAQISENLFVKPASAKAIK
jgi:hypothetical protein